VNFTNDEMIPTPNVYQGEEDTHLNFFQSQDKHLGEHRCLDVPLHWHEQLFLMFLDAPQVPLTYITENNGQQLL